MPASRPIHETSDPLVLLSYDVSAANRSAASRVAHLIFGRADTPDLVPPPYIRRQGVVWIGQSVFVLPRSLATELSEKLRSLGAAVTMAHVSIARSEIDAFRHRSTVVRKHVYGRPG